MAMLKKKGNIEEGSNQYKRHPVAVSQPCIWIVHSSKSRETGHNSHADDTNSRDALNQDMFELDFDVK